MADVFLFAEDVGLAVTVDHVVTTAIHSKVAGTGSSWLIDSLNDSMRWVGKRAVPTKPRIRYADQSDQATMVGDLGKSPRIGGIRVKTRGFFGGRPGQPGAASWRKALIAARPEGPDAIVVAKDTDGDTSSIDGLKQARDVMLDRDPSTVIVIAAPHPEVECWWVSGFQASDEDEARRLSDVCAEVSFDPTKEPHRLTSSPNTAKRDAKRVARMLLLNDDRSTPLDPEETVAACERSLSDLDAVAAARSTGLEAFQNEVVDRLLPLLAG